MTFTEAERTEIARWLANLKAEGHSLGEHLATTAKPGGKGVVRKRYPQNVARFRMIAIRVAILERVAVMP